MTAERPTGRPDLLVIGVGNPERGDDGIGPAVARGVAADPVLGDVRVLVAGGDLSDIVLAWGPTDDVVIVDAVQADRPPGTVIVLDGLVNDLASGDLESGDPGRGAHPLSSHGFGLAAAIELARRLDRLPHTLTVLGVQAAGADTFEPLSDPARGAVGAVVAAIRELAAPKVS